KGGTPSSIGSGRESFFERVKGNQVVDHRPSGECFQIGYSCGTRPYRSGNASAATQDKAIPRVGKNHSNGADKTREASFSPRIIRTKNIKRGSTLRYSKITRKGSRRTVSDYVWWKRRWHVGWKFSRGNSIDYVAISNACERNHLTKIKTVPLDKSIHKGSIGIKVHRNRRVKKSVRKLNSKRARILYGAARRVGCYQRVGQDYSVNTCTRRRLLKKDS